MVTPRTKSTKIVKTAVPAPQTTTEQPLSKIDKRRLKWLTAAELFDAWRTVPRLLVLGYGYMCWAIVEWYMSLTPAILVDCNFELLGELCVVDAPTTQHAVLVSTVVGAAAVVFGLYTNGGRPWAKTKFIKWEDTNMQRSRKYVEEQRSLGNDKDFDDQDGDAFWNDVEQFEDSKELPYDIDDGSEGRPEFSERRREY